MTWSRIRGHEAIVHSFDAAWRKGRLGHAYLFVGPPGVGKHTLARELARSLLCESRSKELQACGKCSGCALVDAGTHPDLFFAARPEDKVDLPIELVRELIEHLSLKPARGGRKVAILDDADDLSDQAANAFLKTLEEPPAGSLLILIGGQSPERQFSTILSRCQVVTFPPLPNDAVKSLLGERGITDSARVDRLVRVAGGSIGQALALDDESLWEFRKVLLSAIVSEKLDAFDLATKWNQHVEEAGKEAGVRRRRASLVLRLAARAAARRVPSIASECRPWWQIRKKRWRLRRFADRLGPDRLFTWIERATEADLQIDRKVQLELVIEAFADALVR